MGLFSSKKIYVASSISNLAGDPARRPDYLKTAVLSKTLLGQSNSMGEVINGAYLNGPGINLRGFYRWASRENNYDEIGMPESSLLLKPTFGPDDLVDILSTALGSDVVIIESETGEVNFSYWAEQFMLEYHPELFDSNWIADYKPETNTILISFEDDSQASFTPTDFDPNGLYLYVLYSELDSDGKPKKDGMYIYKRGSGVAAIDNHIQIVPSLNDGFFPFIPVRLENKFLSPQYESAAFEQAKKAFKKATGGGKLKDIRDALEDSEDLDDIDHAYVVFGPSLNAKDNQSKDYAWTFFTMILDQMAVENQIGVSELDDYVRISNENEERTANYLRWVKITHTPEIPDEDPPSEPPPVPIAKTLPKNSIRITAPNNLPGQFDIEISWNSVEIYGGNGLAKPDTKVGDVWWSYDDLDPIDTSSHFLGPILTAVVRQTSDATIFKQISANEWQAYKFRGLIHRNHVYGGKSVEISAREALTDTEESGFFVPLHYETLKNMSLVDSTQLALVSSQLVVNSYLVKKTNFFKKLLTFVVIIAVVVIATAVFGPAGGVGIGATVAASIGVAGIAALIVSVAVNMIVALIVQAILTPVFTAVFGDVLGSIFATIATAFFMGGIDGLANGASLSSSFGNLMSAQNIMMMTNAVGNGVSQYIQASAMEYQTKTEEYLEDAEKKQDALDNKWIEEFGLTYGVIDPMDLLNPASYTPESPDSFLARTLLTGSDIAELSMDMLTNFAELTLQPQN